MNEEHYFEKKIYRKKTLEEITKKVNLLGVSTKLTPYSFLNIRLIGTIVIFIVILISHDLGYILSPIISILFYLGITYLLIEQKIK